ncbi:MAG: ABC transporter permease, partial [Bacteroidales bacterium]|nr:ABC transporter permease [Bacteroidales bacterium]
MKPELNKKNPVGILTTIMPYLSILTLILIWFSASSVNSELVPSPLMVFDRLVLLFTKPISKLNIFGHIWASLKRVLIALAFATIIGVTLGVLIGWNKTMRKTLGTLFELIRPIPPIAWLPLVIMWYGIGEFPKIVIVFIGALMPVVINTYTGIKMVD